MLGLDAQGISVKLYFFFLQMDGWISRVCLIKDKSGEWLEKKESANWRFYMCTVPICGWAVKLVMNLIQSIICDVIVGGFRFDFF